MSPIRAFITKIVFPDSHVDPDYLDFLHIHVSSLRLYQLCNCVNVVSSTPKMTTPISLLQMRELVKHSNGSLALNRSNHIRNSHLRGNRYFYNSIKNIVPIFRHKHYMLFTIPYHMR